MDGFIVRDRNGLMHIHNVDVAVLGAGPAGAIAARQLGRAGVDVLLIDPFMPRAGHAMESFPASGAPLTEEIGLLGLLCDTSDGPAAAMHMQWRDQPEVQTFEGGGPLLLHRDLSHARLREAALEVAKSLIARVRSIAPTATGAQVVTDAGTVHCRMVLDARGRSAVRRPSADLIALPFTARGAPHAHTMHLAALEAGWIWAVTQADGTAHGAVFQRAATLAGLCLSKRAQYAAHVFAHAEMFRDLSTVETGRPLAAGLSIVDDPVVSDRHIVIGDAALARDPIASHGLVHAMRTAVQAAIAVRTILDPATDTRAALRFVRHKHAVAAAAARRATEQAYRDQSMYSTAFWQQTGSAPQPPAMIGADASGVVSLATPLTRAPVLETDRIRWAPAISLPGTADFITAIGPITALEIAAACRPAASLHEIARRLGRQHSLPVVFEVLEKLTLGGAFAAVARAH